MNKKSDRSVAKATTEILDITIDASPVSLVVSNVEGKITRINEAALELLGYERNELIGQSIEILIPSSLRKKHVREREEFQASLSKRPMGKNRILSAQTRDGHLIPVEIGLNPFVTEEGEFVMAALLDLREKIQAEETLRQRQNDLEASQKRLQKIISSARDGMLLVDQAGAIQFLNQAAEAMLGRVPQKELKLVISNSILDEKASEIDLPQPDGSLFIAELKSVQLEWEGAPATLVSVRDITRRAEMQRKIEEIQKEKLRLKDETLSFVSHELRGPLTAIHHFVDALLNNAAGEISDRQREYLGIARRNIVGLNKMIRDLVDAVRAESGKLSVLRKSVFIPKVFQVVVQDFEELARKRQISLTQEVEDRLPHICADEHRVQQVLTNLVSNAFKYTPDRGKITISAQRSKEGSEKLCFSVADTGRGIESEEAKVIFSRLYQSRNTIEQKPQKGLGLGLYLCKELVTRQGGEIWVESSVGKGSTFSFTLPIYSLKNLLWPTLVQDTHIVPSVAVISVRLVIEKSKILTQAGSQWADAIAEFLGACTLRGIDILLPPKKNERNITEPFVIVAQTNRAGSEAMCQRIQNQLKNFPLTQKLRAEVIFSYSVIDLTPFHLNKRESVTNLVGEITSQIEHLLEEDLPKVEAHDATKENTDRRR